MAEDFKTTVVPDRVTGPSPAVELDLLMWVLFNGYERTETQFRALRDAAGFRLNRIITTKTPGLSSKRSSVRINHDPGTDLSMVNAPPQKGKVGWIC